MVAAKPEESSAERQASRVNALFCKGLDLRAVFITLFILSEQIVSIDAEEYRTFGDEGCRRVNEYNSVINSLNEFTNCHGLVI